MKTKISKKNDSTKFFFEFTDKLNLINPNKKIALGNFNIYYNRITFNLDITTINSKFLLQL